MKEKHYSIKNILKTNADYNMIIGVRSNGKTYSVKEIGLFGYHKDGININGYLDDGSQLGIIRRWEEDFKGKNGQQFFDDFISNDDTGNRIEKATKGKYNNIKYYSGRWFLINVNDQGKIIDSDPVPFAYAFALTSEEHYKSTSYPKIRNILFDEMITRGYYLPDEFIKFTSVISTIVRNRNDIKIFMCGNTISKYCPYFDEMGLYRIKEQKKGSIDVYSYGESDLKVSVEYTDVPSKTKINARLFAFENPKLKMITDGDWEFGIYPHLPVKYNAENILYFYFVEFNDDILQCEIINVKNQIFTFVHRKTSEIKDDGIHLIYKCEYSAIPNHKRKIIYPTSEIEEKIASFYRDDLVFYQSNMIGEIMNAYLKWCRTSE